MLIFRNAKSHCLGAIFCSMWSWGSKSQLQSKSVYVYVSQSLLSHYNFFLAAFPAFSDPRSPSFLGWLPDSLGVSSQFVSLSAYRRSAWENGKAHIATAMACFFLLIYFDLFTIAIYISSSRSAEWLEGNGEGQGYGVGESVQSNKIKLGFIDPFQFDLLPFPLTPPFRHSLLCMATKLKCFY